MDASVTQDAALADVAIEGNDPDASVDSGPWVDPPCNVDVVWQSDFSSDPTQLDRDVDGNPDWVVRAGSPFPTQELSGGQWTSAGSIALDTNPALNITARTYVDVRLRDARIPAPVAGNFEGAIFWINLDFTPTDMVAIYVSVSHTAVDEQEVRVYAKTTGSTTVILIGPEVVGADLVLVQLEIDPVSSMLRAWIDGTPVGTVMFPRLPEVNADQFATVYAASTPGEFDLVRVAVCAP